MNKLRTSYLLMFAFAFTTGCKNKVTPEVTLPQAISDTLDCKQWISMHTTDNNLWLFSVKDFYRISKANTPSLSIGLQKTTPDEDAITDNLMISTDIDSAICIDANKHAIFNFEDSSSIELKNIFGNNCNGSILLAIDCQLQSNAAAQLKKLRTQKIRSIRLELHNGYIDYILNNNDAGDLLQLINCLHGAK